MELYPPALLFDFVNYSLKANNAMSASHNVSRCLIFSLPLLFLSLLLTLIPLLILIALPRRIITESPVWTEPLTFPPPLSSGQSPRPELLAARSLRRVVFLRLPQTRLPGSCCPRWLAVVLPLYNNLPEIYRQWRNSFTLQCDVRLALSR